MSLMSKSEDKRDFQKALTPKIKQLTCKRPLLR